MATLTSMMTTTMILLLLLLLPTLVVAPTSFTVGTDGTVVSGAVSLGSTSALTPLTATLGGTFATFQTGNYVSITHSSGAPRIMMRHQNIQNASEPGYITLTSTAVSGSIDRAYFDITPWSTSIGLRIQAASSAGQVYTMPLTDNTMQLGAAGNKWSAIWAQTTTISTSDANMKTDVQPCRLGLSFIAALQPKQYRWKNLTNDDNYQRFHHGLIAQDVREVLTNMGVSTNDFSGYVEGIHEDGTSYFGLRYESFIAPLINAVQELTAKTSELEARLLRLERMVND